MSPVIIWVLKVLGLVVAAGGVFIAHKKWNFKDDNVIEKVVEEEIKQETGVTVDLEEKDNTPPSKS